MSTVSMETTSTVILSDMVQRVFNYQLQEHYIMQLIKYKQIDTIENSSIRLGTGQQMLDLGWCFQVPWFDFKLEVDFYGSYVVLQSYL